MAINIWANAPDVPGRVCADARLTDRSRIPIPFTARDTTSLDQDYGQAGWQMGINFLNLGDLASKLRTTPIPEPLPDAGRPVRRGEIQRLAIHTHGVSGEIYINGAGSRTTLTARSVPTHHTHLHQIGLMTADHAASPAVILFVGCLAGSGQAGTNLLLALSRVWPNRKVVAFASLGYAPGGEMTRAGQACTEPGMRDTDAIYPGEADRTAGQHWASTTAEPWPWASETSPRAKVAFNNAIIRGASW